MRYFSTFSGIGGFELAMPNDFECVGYSEIDKYAIQIYQKHFPNHKNYGDITEIDIDKLPDFDLLVGGSPCQDLSITKKNRKGLEGDRSGLFYKFVEILEKKKPRYFLLENVASMSKENKNKISEILGVQPIMINASLVSAQNRKRLFWCNWEVEQPEDKGILLKDILQLEHEFNGLYSDYNNKVIFNKSYTLGTGCGTNRSSTFQQVITKPVRIAKIGKGGQGDRVYSIEGKSVNLSANGGGRGAKTGLYAIKNFVRKLIPIECERLQTFPDNWTEGISNTQRYKCLGNAVCVEVIKHIINYLLIYEIQKNRNSQI